MLSATPVNNRFNDLRNQLALAYEGDSENLAQKLQHLDKRSRRSSATRRRVFNAWSKLPPEERTADAILEIARLRLLRAAGRGDDRPLAQAHPDVLRHHRDRRVPRAAASRCRSAAPLTDLPDVLDFNEIFEQLSGADARRLRAARLRLPEPDRASTRSCTTPRSAAARGNLGQADREQGLQAADDGQPAQAAGELGRGLPPHARPSSKRAVDKTLDRHRDARDGAIADMAVDVRPTSMRRRRRLRRPRRCTVGEQGQDRPGRHGHRVLAARPRSTTARSSASCSTRWRRSRPSTTSSSSTSRRMIAEQGRATPSTPATARCSIFSAFADTADYLYRSWRPTCSERGPADGAIVTGSGHARRRRSGSGYDFQQVLTLFSPRSKERHLIMPKRAGEIDVLIGTDCISRGPEPPGLRLPHQLRHPLEPGADHPAVRPHRPHRLDQRQHPARQLLARHLARRVHQPQGARREPHGHRRRRRRPATTTSSTPESQRHRVPQGAAAHASRTRSSSSKTSGPASPSPTSASTTSAWTCSATSRSTATSPPRPKGLHAVVPADPSKGLAARRRSSRCATSTPTRTSTAATACTRTTSSTSTTTARSIADHTEVKHLLDLIRAGCRAPRRAGRRRRTASSTRPPSDGAEMGRYSELLTEAIRSMIERDRGTDLDSLFTGGHDHRAHPDASPGSTTSS